METGSRLTIPQLSYQVIHRSVLKWLLGLNPRSLPAPLWLVAHYLAGLLWVSGAATCVAMAAAATVSHDALRRLLIGEPLVALVRMIALTMINRGAGYLVLDDVTLDKTGEKMSPSTIRRRDRATLGRRAPAMVTLRVTGPRRPGIARVSGTSGNEVDDIAPDCQPSNRSKCSIFTHKPNSRNSPMNANSADLDQDSAAVPAQESAAADPRRGAGLLTGRLISRRPGVACNRLPTWPGSLPAARGPPGSPFRS